MQEVASERAAGHHRPIRDSAGQRPVSGSSRTLRALHPVLGVPLDAVQERPRAVRRPRRPGCRGGCNHELRSWRRGSGPGQSSCFSMSSSASSRRPTADCARSSNPDRAVSPSGSLATAGWIRDRAIPHGISRRFLCPVITSLVAVAVVRRFILQPDGLLNTGLNAVGIQRPDWLNAASAKPSWLGILHHQDRSRRQNPTTQPGHQHEHRQQLANTGSFNCTRQTRTSLTVPEASSGSAVVSPGSVSPSSASCPTSWRLAICPRRGSEQLPGPDSSQL